MSGSLDKLLNYYGTWTSQRRGVAYIIRFCQWLLSRRTPQSPKLSYEDISKAPDLIIRHVQQRAYPEEWAVVTAGKPVSTSSSAASLCPVLRGGVLCVGGRLARAGPLSCDERHPAILPKRHHVSELIMRYCHERTAHAGREQTLVESRRQFWIMNVRALAKDIVRHCTSCRGSTQPVVAADGPSSGSKGHSLSATVQPNWCRLFRTALRETRSWNS